MKEQETGSSVLGLPSSRKSEMRLSQKKIFSFMILNWRQVTAGKNGPKAKEQEIEVADAEKQSHSTFKRNLGKSLVFFYHKQTRAKYHANRCKTGEKV